MQIEKSVQTRLTNQLEANCKRFSKYQNTLNQTIERIEEKSLEKAEKIKAKSVSQKLLEKCKDALINFPKKLRLNLPYIRISEPIKNFIDELNKENLDPDKLDEIFISIEKAANLIDENFENFEKFLKTIREDLLEPFENLKDLKKGIKEFADLSISSLNDSIEALLRFNNGTFNKTLDMLDGTLNEISED